MKGKEEKREGEEEKKAGSKRYCCVESETREAYRGDRRRVRGLKKCDDSERKGRARCRGVSEVDEQEFGVE